MADENYTVAVTETGTDSVKAKILALADAQKKAETATGGLQKALGGISSQNAALGNAFSTATQSAKALDGAITPLQKSLGNNNAAFRSLADSTVLVKNSTATMVGVVGTTSKAVYDQAKAAQEAGTQTSKWTGFVDKAKFAIKDYLGQTFSTTNAINTLNVAQNRNAAASNQAAGAIGNLRERTNDLREVFVGFVGIRVVQFFISAAESARDYTNALQAITAQTGTFNETYAALFAGAQATNTSLEASVGLFTSIASSMSTASGAFVQMSGSAAIFTLDNNAATSSVLNLQKALALNGNSLAVNAAAMKAYDEASQSQKVSLETIKALGVAAPAALAEVSRTLLVAAGSTRGLATAAQQGRVSFQQFNAALNVAIQNTQNLPVPPPTISAAYQGLVNAVQNYAASTNSAVGYTGFFAQVMKLLADNMNVVAPTALLLAGSITAVVIAITGIKLGMIIAQMVVFATTTTAAAVAWGLLNLPIVAAVGIFAALTFAVIKFSETLAAMTKGIPVLGDAFAWINEKATALKETLSSGYEAVTGFANKLSEMGNVQKQTEAQTQALTDAFKGFNGTVPFSTKAANDNASALRSIDAEAPGAAGGLRSVGAAAASATLGMNAFNTSALASQTIMSKWGYQTDLGTESAQNYEAQMRATGHVLNGFGEWVKGASSAVQGLTGDMNELTEATTRAAGAGGSFGNAFNGGIFKPTVGDNGPAPDPLGWMNVGPKKWVDANGRLWFGTLEEVNAKRNGLYGFGEKPAATPTPTPTPTKSGSGGGGGGGMGMLSDGPGVVMPAPAPVVNVTNIYNVKDYDSFRRSEKQMAQDQLRTLARA